jgi:hypothetical protein
MLGRIAVCSIWPAVTCSTRHYLPNAVLSGHLRRPTWVCAHESLHILQLPGPALNGVLQQLEPCSLACTAMTCSQMSHAVPASISSVAVNCRTPQQRDSFKLWLQQHGNSIRECIIQIAGSTFSLDRLPCPHLRVLSLNSVNVQLQPAYASDSPGVLRCCRGLTGLSLQHCGRTHRLPLQPLQHCQSCAASACLQLTQSQPSVVMVYAHTCSPLHGSQSSQRSG